MHIIDVREAVVSLDQTMDDVCRDHEAAAIVRRRGKPVVVLSLDDFNSMNETIYLLSSPPNASRLRNSITQMRAGGLLHKLKRKPID